ncbi:PREDICTED: uncharacterized protein LOC104767947 isoform X2 [Camelina sativa]|uniref:Uncharacterized protein LOC104767947 isoform X2 n=1 Tax=Camelina sativa TaxID=90675 RepID=A0ABM1RCK8_CAMSA|nr:PREDICTED: uncharacterized protein LOC104767948 isoform X2 [Camelina sativa]XP_019096748.1 PREDICTED: uncharacterized protein LOC104767947 isoform X2 [Camelina sativa]
MAELEADSTVSDGTSHRRELTSDECTAIFPECTEKDSLGTPYGVGSLKDTLGKGKGNQQTEAFLTLQEQLKEAHSQIEVHAEIQATLNAEAAAREKETALLVAEQKQEIKELTMMEKFMRHTNPAYLEFIASQSAEEDTEEDNLPSTTP